MKTFLKSGLIVVFMMWGMESKSNIQTQINSLQNSLDSLGQELQSLTTGLSKIKQKIDFSENQLALPLPKRKAFIADENSWQRYPIRFTPEDMLGKFYLPQGLNPKSCQVVEGSFTYYNGIPQGASPGSFQAKSDLYSDGGWGCCWRSFLNVMNKVKEWLEKRGIVATKKEHFDMDDIRNEWGVGEWERLEGNRRWIEPAENAELYLRFIKRWYSSQDQKKINEKLGFRGRLYLTDNSLFGKDSFLNEDERETGADLKELGEFLGVPSGEDLIEILKAFYKKRYDSSNIKVEDFPMFDEKKRPFPVTIDDGTLARNLYGFHAGGDQLLTHVFLGEVHVYNYAGGSPWTSSGWKSVNSIIANQNIMMFEVFLKDSSSVASQAIQTMRPGVLKAHKKTPEDLKIALEELVKKTNKTLYVYPHSKRSHRSLLVFRSDGSFYYDEKENFKYFSPDTTGVLVLFMDSEIDKTLLLLVQRRGSGAGAEHRQKCSWFAFQPEDFRDRRDTSEGVQKLLKWLKE